MVKNDEFASGELINHLRENIGEPSFVNMEGFMQDINIDLIVFEANTNRNYHTIVTSGMSNYSSNVEEGCEEWKYTELIMYLPSEWPLRQADIQDELYWPFGWLRKLGKFTFDHQTWFCYGDSIPNGDPPQLLSNNNPFTGFMLLPPINENPDFFTLKTPDKEIQFLVVFPVFLEEMNFLRNNEFTLLLEKFDDCHINDIINLQRVNVCE